jgi:hypothetical protein
VPDLRADACAAGIIAASLAGELPTAAHAAR